MGDKDWLVTKIETPPAQHSALGDIKPLARVLGQLLGRQTLTSTAELSARQAMVRIDLRHQWCPL